MVLLALICTLDNPGSSKPVVIIKETDLSHVGVLKRGSYKEGLTFLVRETTRRVGFEERKIITHENSKMFVYKQKNPNLCLYAICDNQDYSKYAGFACIKEFDNEINHIYKTNENLSSMTQKDLNLKNDRIKALLVKYRNCDDIDKLETANMKLEEIQGLVEENFTKLIKNENIDQLLQESKDIKFKTKLYLKNTKKVGKCC